MPWTYAQKSLELIKTRDGSHTVFVPEFNVSYHSVHGAITESEHVFIENGLSALPASSEISILEMGFGTGLNVLLTLLNERRNEVPIFYHVIDNYQLPIELVKQLNYPSVLNISPDIFYQLHELPWDQLHSCKSGFTLLKSFKDVEEASFNRAYDLVYYDAFAPGAQAHLWESRLLGRIHQCIKPGGILVTYCAKGAFKRTLKEVGFLVETLPGPPGKREMTRGRKSG